MTKSMWTPARRTSNFKIIGIKMVLVPPFAAVTASILLELTASILQSLDFGTLLRGLASIQPEEH
jgi:hypothetical protein